MADAALKFRAPTLSAIGDIILDASINETHSAASEITDHPVETGASVTDHTRALPREVSITGLVTMSSLGDSSAPRLTPSEVFAELVRIKDSGEPLSLVTQLASYKDMLIGSITVPRDATKGDSLEFSATLKQIKRATTQERIVKTNTATPGTKGKQKLGPLSFKPWPAYERIKTDAAALEASSEARRKKESSSSMLDRLTGSSEDSTTPRGTAGIEGFTGRVSY